MKVTHVEEEMGVVIKVGVAIPCLTIVKYTVTPMVCIIKS